MNQEPALPRHIGIIMDGNGRWAKLHGKPRVYGHSQGAESVREIVRACREMGIEALTLFAFSEQNWERPPAEVSALMELLLKYVIEEQSEIMDNRIRLATIGQTERLPSFVRLPLRHLIDQSAANQGMVLCLALSYGSREDIVCGVRQLCQAAKDGRLDPTQIDEKAVSSSLTTAGLPPLDLLIRTSGEQRISNFLLWEAAYAELYFTSVMWPDFRRPQLAQALAEYAKRERRFGLTSEQLIEESDEEE